MGNREHTKRQIINKVNIKTPPLSKCPQLLLFGPTYKYKYGVFVHLQK